MYPKLEAWIGGGIFLSVFIWGVAQLNLHRFEHIAAAANAAEAHKSGNDFAALVGQKLKSQFPSRIVNPDVELRIKETDGKVAYQLIWSCRIVPALPETADWYFDRRGTMLPGATSAAARAAITQEIERSGKVQQVIDAFRAQYHNHRMPNEFVATTCAESSTAHWCLKEYFIAARKENPP